MPDLPPPAWLSVVNLVPSAASCGTEWTYDGTTEGCTLIGPLNCSGNVASKIFPVPVGVVYDRVRIEIVGLQWKSTDGFSVDTAPFGLDDIYLEGVSITTVSITPAAPRRHLYSFASGLFKNKQGYQSCPCQGGQPAPSFVGDQWTCDSGNFDANYADMWYVAQPLWDGDSTGPSCAAPPPNMVYEATLSPPAHEDIEVRLMQDGCDERVAIRKLKIEVFGVVGVPSP